MSIILFNFVASTLFVEMTKNCFLSGEFVPIIGYKFHNVELLEKFSAKIYPAFESEEKKEQRMYDVLFFEVTGIINDVLPTLLDFKGEATV